MNATEDQTGLVDITFPQAPTEVVEIAQQMGRDLQRVGTHITSAPAFEWVLQIADDIKRGTPTCAGRALKANIAALGRYIHNPEIQMAFRNGFDL